MKERYEDIHSSKRIHLRDENLVVVDQVKYFHSWFVVLKPLQLVKGNISCTFTGLYLNDGAQLEYHCLIYSFKKILIYRMLALYKSPQFSLCLKQAILAAVSFKASLQMSPLCLDWLLSPTFSNAGGYINKL